MAATVEILKEKIARIQQELGEVREALDELAQASTSSATLHATKPHPLAGLAFADIPALLPLVDQAFAEMGIGVTQPSPTPEEVQQLMLREGVKPEDNIGSRAIIEARER